MTDDLAAAVARLKTARHLIWSESPHKYRIEMSAHIDAHLKEKP